MEMENFRALAVKLASSDRDRPLTESRKTLIEKRLRDFFPDFHTPNHPTYASIKSQPKIITDFNMPIAPQKLEQKQPPELPSAERAQKLKCKQKQEKPQHRQLRPRPPKPEQATAKLPNMGTLQGLKQKPSEELIQRGQKKPKPNGLQKLFEQKTRTNSLDSLLALLWKLERQPVFPSPKRAKQQDKQPQENPQRMKLRTRCPKSEATAYTTTTQSEPVQDQHEEQQELDCQDGGRPLERKSDMTSTIVESSPSDHHNQHEST